MYGKVTRNAWRRRTKDNTDEDGKPEQPGGLVSLDQLTYPTMGFIAHMCGIITTKRYTCATVYVHQASKLGFVWIKKTTAAKDTMEVKKYFENMHDIGEFKSSIITQITGYSRAKRGS